MIWGWGPSSPDMLAISKAQQNAAASKRVISYTAVKAMNSLPLSARFYLLGT